MKKTIKNLVIVCLLVLATIVVAPNVFAAILPDNQKGSITVSNLETKQSVNIKLYRLIDVKVENGQPKSPVYTWTTSIAEWIKGNTELDNAKYFVDVTKSNEVKEFSSADAKKLYEELAKAIRGGQLSIDPEASASTSCTGEGDNKKCDSSHTFGNLTQGAYYILVDGGMKVYSPTSANVVPKYTTDWNIATDSASGTNVNVEMKASEPSIEKKVNNKDNTSAKIGDELTFTLNITVPTYPSNAINKKFVITDKLSGGLTYNNDAVIKDQKGSTISQIVSFYKDTNTITIDFSGDNYSKIEGQTTITVTYTATLNENAEITTPNTNDAKIVYNNDPYNETSNDTEDEDKTKVFTYGLNIIKKGTDDQNGLAGARFEISDGTNTLCFKATSTAGTYTYAGIKDATNGCASGTVYEVETPTNGNLVLKGLDQGTYSATETFAPNGYVKLQAPVTFTVTDEELTGILTSDTADEKANDGIITKTVMNNKGITLPVTGGIGTLIFSIVGILFMGISIVLIKNILKKKEVQL